jgi:HSP20 family molecular chaperone IbpA
MLDMPGVTKDRLTVKADRSELVIEGDASIDMPTGHGGGVCRDPLCSLSPDLHADHELDADAIEASMKDGVLSIRIPKRAELKPRHIEIQAT